MATQTKKHSDNCKMAWGRKDPQCPRCQDLLNGARPIVWNSSKKDRDLAFSRSLKSHNCTVSNCGPICTFGDW